jgi:hypothetical protein
MSPEMSLDALKNNLTNPARPYLFEVIIPDPVGGTTELWQIRAQTASIPGKSFTEILIPFKQTAGVKFAGKEVYDHALPLTFIEGEDRATFDALYTWLQSIIHNRTGLGGGDTTIKKDIFLDLIDTDGTVSMRIKMMGCYPQDVGNVDLATADEGGSGMTFTCTFSYDRWEKV